MFLQFKNAFWAFCLLACFPLYSLGQMLLFFHDQNHKDFYIGLTKYSSSWINSHLVLMLSLLLMIPAYLAIGTYLKNRNYPIWFGLSFFFLILCIFVMFGQFTIDLCLVEVAKLPEDKANLLVEKIQTNAVIEPLFYDNSKLSILFKYIDFWFLSQIFLAGAFFTARKLPKWELAIFFTALIITQLGPLLDPFYGKVLKRVGYSLFSFAYFPIAVSIFKNKKSKAMTTD
ncbi:MAG: hypothetical protein IPN80_13520 [Flavobacterium sp.]|nr:hypothetical protein [Flavobacterium sp.]